MTSAKRSVSALRSPIAVESRALMFRFVFGVGLASLLSCGGTSLVSSDDASGPRAPESDAPSSDRVRWLQSATNDAFWVDQSPERDWLVVDGVRVEAAPNGQLIAAASAPDVALEGSLRIDSALGGGFLHWTDREIYRSETFLGPMRRLELPLSDDITISGAENGLTEVWVFTSVGAVVLQRDGQALVAPPRADVQAALAIDRTRAIETDVWGEMRLTVDGGQSWRKPDLGIGSVRGLRRVGDAIWLTGTNGEVLIRGPQLSELGDPPQLSLDLSTWEAYFPGSRRAEVDQQSWRTHQSLLQSAVRGNPRLGLNRWLGLTADRVAYLDVRTGEKLSSWSDPLHNGLLCEPFEVDGGVAVACQWEQYQYSGAYLMRFTSERSFSIEKAFSESGLFVGTSSGGLGYVGGCAEDRTFNDGQSYRNDDYDRSVICVRRSDGTWFERSVEGFAASSLLRWIPKPDGTAVALVSAVARERAGLPATAADRLPKNHAGVTLQRISVPDQFSVDPQSLGGRSDASRIDRAFSVQPDGSISGWLSDQHRSGADVFQVPITIGASGEITMPALPDGTDATIATGQFALALDQDQQLWETTDYGASWRPCGRSPVRSNAFIGGCSAIGCSVGSFVRVGWGTDHADVVLDVPEGPSAAAGAVALHCDAKGLPVVSETPQTALVAAAGEKASASRFKNPIGEDLFVVRMPDVNVAEETEAADRLDLAVAQVTGAGGTPVLPVAKHTHMLWWSHPFNLGEGSVSDEVLPALDSGSSPSMFPVLGSGGQLGYIVAAERAAWLLSSERNKTAVHELSLREQARYMWRNSSPSGGLLINQALGMLAVGAQQRFTIEVLGGESSTAPVFFGAELNQMRRRHFSLGWSATGKPVLLAFNGPTPDPVSVRPLDLGGGPGDVRSVARWVSAQSIDSPACRARQEGFRSIAVVDPRGWFALAGAGARQWELDDAGMVLARWGADIVCVEAVQLKVKGQEPNSDALLIVDFASRAGLNAVVRHEHGRQTMSCQMEPTR